MYSVSVSIYMPKCTWMYYICVYTIMLHRNYFEKKNLNYLVNTQHTGLCHIDLFLSKDFRLQNP